MATTPRAAPARHRRRPRGRWAAGAAVLLLLSAVVLGRAFVVPPSDAPRATDLVVVLGGLDSRSRWATTERVAAAHPGSTVLNFLADPQYCPDLPRGAVDLVCAVPDPPTTRGEARAAAVLAEERGLRTMSVVTTADQVVRAELRFARCFPGRIVMVQAPTSRWDVLIRVPYQSAATVKAVLLERDC